MASSSPAPPQFPDLPPPDPDHVHLRTAYLVTGNPRPPHYLGSLSLNTTISALKEKIQSELPEHPSPSEQRLIYQAVPCSEMMPTYETFSEYLTVYPILSRIQSIS
ncbi:hypothetical protein CLAIMM_09430 [Cladophialophora immunda]|nr:hypothetical protein CLAIMM_09430 [Cladophialophora immunda]